MGVPLITVGVAIAGLGVGVPKVAVGIAVAGMNVCVALTEVGVPVAEVSVGVLLATRIGVAVPPAVAGALGGVWDETAEGRAGSVALGCPGLVGEGTGDRVGVWLRGASPAGTPVDCGVLGPAVGLLLGPALLLGPVSSLWIIWRTACTVGAALATSPTVSLITAGAAPAASRAAATSFS